MVKCLFSLRFIPSSLCPVSQGTTFPRIPCQKRLVNGRQWYKTGELDKGEIMVYLLLFPLVCGFSTAVVVSPPCFQIPLYTPFVCPSSCWATHVAPALIEQPCFWSLGNSPSSPKSGSQLLLFLTFELSLWSPFSFLVFPSPKWPIPVFNSVCKLWCSFYFTGQTLMNTVMFSLVLSLSRNFAEPLSRMGRVTVLLTPLATLALAMIITWLLAQEGWETQARV